MIFQRQPKYSYLRIRATEHNTSYFRANVHTVNKMYGFIKYFLPVHLFLHSCCLPSLYFVFQCYYALLIWSGHIPTATKFLHTVLNHWRDTIIYNNRLHGLSAPLEHHLHASLNSMGAAWLVHKRANKACIRKCYCHQNWQEEWGKWELLSLLIPSQHQWPQSEFHCLCGRRVRERNLEIPILFLNQMKENGCCGIPEGTQVGKSCSS